jgi:O-antigen/teichoic acid export membrane protein
MAGAVFGLGIYIGYIAYQTSNIHFGLRTNRRWAILLLQFGFSVLIIRFSGLVNLEWGKMTAGWFLSLDEVTLYDVGNRLNWMLWMIPAIALPILLPASSELDVDRKPIVSQVFLVGSKLVLTPSIFFFMFGWVMADQIITIWIGPAFATQSALIFRVLAIGFSTNIAIQVGTTILLGTNRKRILAKWCSADAVFSIVLSFVLTPIFGLVGLLAAITIPWTITNIALGERCCKELDVSVGHFIAYCVRRQVLAGGVAVLPALLVKLFIASDPLSLVVAFALGLGIYTGAILMMKVVGLKELSLLRGLVIVSRRQAKGVE